MRDTKRILGGFDRNETPLQLISDQNITSEPIKTNQIGLSVASSLFVYIVSADSVVSATINTLTLTTSVAQVGDIISFTSGTLLNLEIKVKSVSGMTVTLVNNLPSIPAPGSTLNILRYRYPVVSSSGGLTVTAIQGTTPWITKDQADGPVTPGTVALFSQLIGGQYNTVLPVLTTGQQAAIQTDSSARLLIGSIFSPLPAGTNLLGSINAIQSGTWNINNITGTISLPTGASTSALQTTGNTSLASIDSKLATLGQKTMTGSMPVVIASNQSAISVNNTPQAGTKATYSGSILNSGLSTPFAGIIGYFLILQGSATKTIKITRIGLSGTATTANQYKFGVERVTFVTGGTPTVVTPASHDNTNGAATAVLTQYASGATPGSLSNFPFRFWNVCLPTTATNTEGTMIDSVYGDGAGQPIVLRGTGDYIALSQNGAAIAGAAINAYIEWTEE